MTMLLKAADISNPAKPFHLAKSWAFKIYEESFLQGDAERIKHMDTKNDMTKRSTYKANGEGLQKLRDEQIGFAEGVIKPFYEEWAKLLGHEFMKPILQNFVTNKAEWESFSMNDAEFLRDFRNRAK